MKKQGGSTVENLLKVSMVGDDLTSSLRNWESVIAGMNHVPEEMVLRDILLRQIWKSSRSRVKYDLEIYDHAKEGSPSHAFFLLQSIRDLLTWERVTVAQAVISEGSVVTPAIESERSVIFPLFSQGVTHVPCRLPASRDPSGQDDLGL